MTFKENFDIKKKIVLSYHFHVRGRLQYMEQAKMLTPTPRVRNKNNLFAHTLILQLLTPEVRIFTLTFIFYTKLTPRIVDGLRVKCS